VLEKHLCPLKPTVIIGLDARGFTFATALALRLIIIKMTSIPIKEFRRPEGDMEPGGRQAKEFTAFQTTGCYSNWTELQHLRPHKQSCFDFR
jgi:hypothetical protein